MSKSKVVLIRCESYEQSVVNKAIKKGVDLLGGTEVFLSAGEKILLKPNMLAADNPEKCSVTHPAVFEGVLNLLSGENVTLTYGDSPGFHSPAAAAKKIGITAAADKYGAGPADFDSDEEVFYEEALQNKKLRLAKGVLDADGLISIPKLKTHGLQKMTGAIKNQFGCVPGPLKGEMHVKLTSADDFAKMLVDINAYIRPRLFVMDGIMAMEGNGPRGGNPIPMNVLIFATDPVAMDATICRLIDLDPAFVPTTRMGQDVGLGTYEEANIELLGDPIDSFRLPAFNVDRSPLQSYKQGLWATVTNKLLVPKPFIKEDQCVQCGVCVLMCPVEEKAVNWDNDNKNKAPIYDYSKCIRCYCCQEMCPESAIELDVPILRRLIDKKYKK